MPLIKLIILILMIFIKSTLYAQDNLVVIPAATYKIADKKSFEFAFIHTFLLTGNRHKYLMLI